MPTRASLHADNLLRLREVVTSGLPSHRTVVLHGPEGMDLYDIVCALRDDFSEEQVLTVHGYCGGGTAQPFQPFAQMIQALALMPGLNVLIAMNRAMYL